MHKVILQVEYYQLIILPLLKCLPIPFINLQLGSSTDFTSREAFILALEEEK